MNAGLPGTGIAGIFYFFSIVALLLSEVWLLMRGKSRKKTWQYITPTLIITVGMIIAGWLTNFAIVWIVSAYQQYIAGPGSMKYTLQIAVHPLLVPVILLFLVLMATQIIRLFHKYASAKKKNK